MRFLALILFASALGGEEPSLARWQSTYEAWSRGMDNVRLGGARWSADGERLAFDDDIVRQTLKQEVVDLEIALGVGEARAVAYGCDLTKGYIEENAAYYSS